jgi:GT2 family glycosyltransferase
MNLQKYLSEAKIGAVVIGRNEGERLITCLNSLIDKVKHIVYVDSGSTDDSIQNATKLGVHILALDMTIPFTAARARNEGANYLLQQQDDLECIQFVDGDCEIQQNWLEDAVKFLEGNPKYAVVCGRRRERFPNQSIYNQLCDIEWDTPIGDALACGGDALIRVESFIQVRGYNDSLIAGEEPEMCFRLRQKSWKIKRIDAEMTLHDAAMTRFKQWWYRAKRAGFAYAISCYLHGKTEEKFKCKEVLSIFMWTILIPTVILSLTIVDYKFILLILVYPLQFIKLIIRFVNKGLTKETALLNAFFTIVAKWPQLLGMLQFLTDRIGGKRSRLIEYK